MIIHTKYTGWCDNDFNVYAYFARLAAPAVAGFEARLAQLCEPEHAHQRPHLPEATWQHRTVVLLSNGRSVGPMGLDSYH